MDIVNAAQIRQEELEALGFESPEQYEEHQRVMKASRELAKQQLATVFTAPTC